MVQLNHESESSKHKQKGNRQSYNCSMCDFTNHTGSIQLIMNHFKVHPKCYICGEQYHGTNGSRNLKNHMIKLKKFETVYIPEGYAHGALSHTKSLLHIFSKKKYNDKNSIKINWKDPHLKIQWPINKDVKIVISKNHNDYKFLKKKFK